MWIFPTETNEVREVEGTFLWMCDFFSCPQKAILAGSQPEELLFFLKSGFLYQYYEVGEQRKITRNHFIPQDCSVWQRNSKSNVRIEMVHYHNAAPTGLPITPHRMLWGLQVVLFSNVFTFCCILIGVKENGQNQYDC